jgi:transposase
MARRPPDGKARELARSRTLNPRPEAVSDEAFSSSGFFDARDLVQVKYEMVRRVETDGSSVSAAADAFGFSRQSYYTAAQALADEGLAGLVPAKPGPRGAHKLTDEVLDHLAGLRAADPDVRPAELAAAVASRFGVRVHPRSVERALARREADARSTKSG